MLFFLHCRYTHVSITKTNPLVLYKETVAFLYCESSKTHEHTLFTEFFILIER